MSTKGESSSLRTLSTAGRSLVIVGTYVCLVLLAELLWPLEWAMLPILGCAFILSGFLNAAHECVHLVHVGSRRLNRIIGVMWCTPILVNFTVYRYQHLVHHRFPGDVGDSEQHVCIDTLSDYLKAQSGVGFWRAVIKRMALTWKGIFPPSVISARAEHSSRLDNWLIHIWLCFCICITPVFPKLIFLGYWLPLLFYPLFVLFFSLPEHFSLTHKAVAWPRAHNVKSNIIVRFYQWSANYHALHHREPMLTAFSLHRAWILQGFKTDPEQPSYLAFHTRLLRDCINRAGKHLQ